MQSIDRELHNNKTNEIKALVSDEQTEIDEFNQIIKCSNLKFITK